MLVKGALASIGSFRDAGLTSGRSTNDENNEISFDHRDPLNLPEEKVDRLIFNIFISNKYAAIDII